MEAKNDQSTITDGEFLTIVRAAKNGDTDAMLQLIELFKEDIMKASQFIQMPQEDAVAEIVLELLQFIKEGGE